VLQPFYEANRNLLVNINGRLVHRDHAGVSPFDSAVQNGDAVWEGLRLYAGRIFRLREHLQRLKRGAAALSYSGLPDDADIVRELRRTLEANQMHDSVHIRLTLSRGVKYTSGMDPRLNRALPAPGAAAPDAGGCTLIIVAEHKPPVYDKAAGVRLITAQHRRPPAEVLDQRIHSCNQLTSILAKMEATAAGADDALMLDTRGFVAETNATHVFIVPEAGGAGRGSASAPCLCTPRTVACPEGITRAAVLELCRRHDLPHEERDLTLAEVRAAREVFCTGTMGEIAPVIELDGRAIGGGSIGPMTAQLSEWFARLVSTESEPLD